MWIEIKQKCLIENQSNKERTWIIKKSIWNDDQNQNIKNIIKYLNIINSFIKVIGLIQSIKNTKQITNQSKNKERKMGNCCSNDDDRPDHGYV